LNVAFNPEIKTGMVYLLKGILIGRLGARLAKVMILPN